MAPIVVIEVASFSCLHCRAFQAQVFPALRDRYIASGQVRWVMLNSAEDAVGGDGRIFLVGRCLWSERSFWPVAEFLFRIGNQPPDTLEPLLAENTDIDPDRLGSCLADPATRRLVEADLAEFRRLHVVGTPYFYVRRRRTSGEWEETEIAGYQSREYFGRVFDRLLRSP